MKNIMDTLTPMPPFNPKRKNNVFKVGKPKAVNAIKATNLKLK